MKSDKYTGTILKNEFTIKKFYTIHYFEYTKDFSFCGEKHDFWEMLYIDKGEAYIYAGDASFRLMQGEAVFHFPGEWHNIKISGSSVPDIIVLSFECKSASMDFFKSKILHLTNDEKRLLGNIIKEGKAAFREPFGDPTTKRLIRRESAAADSEQMVRNLTEQLLISLRRNNLLKQKDNSLLKERFDNDIVEDVVEFLNQNTGAKLKFEDVLQFAKTSSTTLKTLFAKRMNCGVMDYFSTLKIESAKRFIREENYNFTQISRLLGYDSLHYFSRQFKQKTGMSPTEYANSVHIIIDKK